MPKSAAAVGVVRMAHMFKTKYVTAPIIPIYCCA
jgi:hypothetical protein